LLFRSRQAGAGDQFRLAPSAEIADYAGAFERQAHGRGEEDRTVAHRRREEPNMGLMIGCKNTTMAELAQNLQEMAHAYNRSPDS
jgi:hypothetical protein